jgi:uncharacterized protein with ParB-like and HNH nuclease domain
MKAVEATLLNFLSGVKQFTVPIYQRTYSWRVPQCDQLWRDVKRVADNPSARAHFVGSVVYIQKGIYQSVNVPQLLVIDGQQRLTTLTLLLLALSRALEAMGDAAPINPQKITDYYLFNPLESGPLRFKLQLTRGDQETLLRLLQGNPAPERAAKRLLENYVYFDTKLKQPGVDLVRVFEGLHKLMVVDISLDREHDNPQLIFESLNSTGLDLTQADLIRNYVLMGLEPRDQDELYEQYWYPMEQAFAVGEPNLFDRFMRDYLTLKTRNIPKLEHVYEAFKTYHRSRNLPAAHIRELVEEIHRFSRSYMRLVKPEHESDRHIRNALEDLKVLKVDVAFPFLLELIDDAAQDVLSRADLLAALRMTESYVFRRVVCGLAANGLNKVFPMLTNALDKTRYLESLGVRFMRQKGVFRFPTDEDFKADCAVWNAYYGGRAAYFLRRLENHDRKEPVDTREFATIEHILPQTQNLSKSWRTMLGPDWQELHAEWVHTVGNLTLTGYNSELSDRPFLEKRNTPGGFADSPLRLNADLRTLERWDSDEIRKRGRRMANKALKVWSQPQVPVELLAGNSAVSSSSEDLAPHFEEASEQLESLYVELETAFKALSELNFVAGFKTKIALRTRHMAWQQGSFAAMPISGVGVGNIADITVQAANDRLGIWVNVPFDELNDPFGLLEKPNSSSTNRWTRFYLTPLNGAEVGLDLIRQAFEWWRFDADTDED